MQDAGGTLQATPSSLSSYPTYTPPPPPPARKKGHAVSAIATETQTKTQAQRTFYEECEDVLQVIRNDAAVSMNGGCGASVAASTRHEKYRAILAEVEHLNRVLEVTIDERDDLEGELRGRLMQAELSLRERDEVVQQKDAELRRLHDVVASLTMRLEALERGRFEVVNTSIADGRKSGGCGGCDDQMDLGIRAEVFPLVKTGSGTSSIDVNVAAPDPAAITAAAVSTATTASTSTTYRLGQSALRWVKFLLERCFPRDNVNSENLGALLTLLENLLRQSSDPFVDEAVVQPLCKQVSNCLIGLVCKDAEEQRRSQLPATNPGGAQRSGHEQENELQQLVAHLEAERDTLRQHVSAVSEENVELMWRLKALEEPSPQTVPSFSVRTDHLGVQNAMLLAERERQTAFIAELERQVRQLEEEKQLLEGRLDQRNESLQRHERVLDFLSRHGCGGGRGMTRSE